MKKYAQTREESGEVLRVVIQRMAGQPAAFTPYNFTLWYEYVAGCNPRLTSAINAMLESGKKMDDEAVDKLYGQFVEGEYHALREAMNKLVAQVAGVTAETGKQAHAFGNNLQSYGDSLKEGLDPSGMAQLISTMAGDTAKLRDSMRQMESQLQASKQEVDQLHMELESARGEALSDPLTGVLNRRGFEARVQPVFDDGTLSEKGGCLLMLDIDHFKKINDTYGHLFGDKVIRAIAQMLKSKVKGRDAVARLGGEEFAVFLPETARKGAIVVAEQIRQGVEMGKIRRLDTQEQIGGFTISIGVAEYAKGSTLVEMLDQADKALYSSKQNGRNRTTVFG